MNRRFTLSLLGLLGLGQHVSGAAVCAPAALFLCCLVLTAKTSDADAVSSVAPGGTERAHTSPLNAPRNASELTTALAVTCPV
jgi:hypothetical protein